MEKSEQVVTRFLNLIFQHKNDCGVGNFLELQLRYLMSLLSNMVFFGISTDIDELIVDGIPASVSPRDHVYPCRGFSSDVRAEGVTKRQHRVRLPQSGTNEIFLIDLNLLCFWMCAELFLRETSGFEP